MTKPYQQSLVRASLKAVILNEHGEVLVVKENGRDWWDIPGGGIERGESLQQALARELFEEVSLQGDFTFSVILVEDPHYIQSNDVYQMRITFAVQPERYEFTPGDDGDEVMFIDPAHFAEAEDWRERKIYEFSELAKKLV